MSHVKNTPGMCIQATLTHRSSLTCALQPSEAWLWGLCHHEASSSSASSPCASSPVHPDPRASRNTRGFVLRFTVLHRHILNHCQAGPSKHCPTGETSDKHRRIVRAKHFQPQSLSGNWLNKWGKPHYIWFWAGQKLYYASHFLYIKHIALVGQAYLSKLADFLSYTSVSEWRTQKSHHLNNCHVRWQLCLCYTIICEARVVSGGSNGPTALLFYLSISKSEKRRSEH